MPDTNSYAAIYCQNLHHSREYTYDFYRLTSLDSAATIICLQEAGQCQNSLPVAPRRPWQLWAEPTDSTHLGGAAICWNANFVQAVPVPMDNPFFAVIDATFIQTQFKVTVASVYRAPSKNIDTLPLIQLLATRQRVIITGDFNAHHSCWGSRDDDDAGEDILDCFTQAGYNLFNDTDLGPTFYSERSSSFIDLTWARNVNIFGWTIQDSVGSDHRTIKFRIPVCFQAGSIMKYGYGLCWIWMDVHVRIVSPGKRDIGCACCLNMQEKLCNA